MSHLVSNIKMSNTEVPQNAKEENRTGTDWDKLHQTGETGWNIGTTSPPIQEIINNGDLKQLNAKTLLVPGCGVGHDVVALQQGLNLEKAVGLDISPTAVQHAIDLHKNMHSAVKFVCGDFFQHAQEHQYDLGYDYTFLCALHPSMREAWATATTSYIAKGGHLLTLMFPLFPKEGGPPFEVSVQLYHDLLDETFDLVWIRDDIKSEPKRQGKENLALWRKK
jgi:hypothetical protein